MPPGASLRRAAERGFLFRERGNAGREPVESTLRASGAEPRPLWQSISTQTLVRGAAEGLGIAVLPLFLVESALQQARVCRFQAEGIRSHRRFRLLVHPDKYLTRPMVMLFCGKSGFFHLSRL